MGLKFCQRVYKLIGKNVNRKILLLDNPSFKDWEKGEYVSWQGDLKGSYRCCRKLRTVSWAWQTCKYCWTCSPMAWYINKNEGSFFQIASA